MTFIHLAVFVMTFIVVRALWTFVFHPKKRLLATLALLYFVPAIIWLEWPLIQQGFYVINRRLISPQEYIVLADHSHSQMDGGAKSVYLISLDGDQKIRLPYQASSGIEFASISPDKARLMVVKDSGIDFINLNTGAVFEAIENNKITKSSPTWSPDSQHIVYEVRPNIYIYDLATHKSERIVEGTIPIWSIDGEHILFLRNSNVHTFDLSKLTINQITSTSFTPALKDGSNFVWSPNNTKLAFTSDVEGYRAIYTVNLNDSKVTRLTDKTAANQAFTTRLIWSPDSTKILFPCRHRYSEYAADLCLVNIDGSEQMFLTDTENILEYPTLWLSDGSKILFNVFDPTTEIGISLQYISLEDLRPQLLYIYNSGATNKIVTDNQ